MKIHTERTDTTLGQAWIKRKLKQKAIDYAQFPLSLLCLLIMESFMNHN